MNFKCAIDRYIQTFLLLFVKNINNADWKKKSIGNCAGAPVFCLQIHLVCYVTCKQWIEQQRPITQRRRQWHRQQQRQQRHTLDYIIVDYESEVSFYFISLFPSYRLEHCKSQNKITTSKNGVRWGITHSKQTRWWFVFERRALKVFKCKYDTWKDQLKKNVGKKSAAREHTLQSGFVDQSHSRSLVFMPWKYMEKFTFFFSNAYDLNVKCFTSKYR